MSLRERVGFNPLTLRRKALDLAFELGILLRSDETLAEFAETFENLKFEKYFTP
jgi:hypothetical protein